MYNWIVWVQESTLKSREDYMAKKKGKCKRKFIPIILGIVCMTLFGCADASRQLGPLDKNVIVFCGDVNPQVTKEGNTEAPENAPEFKVKIPFKALPGGE